MEWESVCELAMFYFKTFFGLPRRLVISGESDRSDRGTIRFLLFSVV